MVQQTDRGTSREVNRLKKEVTSQEEQVDFVAMPRLSPIASGLDPRTDEEKK